jgi:hypothetical protein
MNQVQVFPRNRLLCFLQPNLDEANNPPDALDKIIAYFMNHHVMVCNRYSAEESLRVLQDLVAFTINYNYTPEHVVNVRIDFSQYKFDHNANFNLAPLDLQQNTNGKYWESSSMIPGENELTMLVPECARKVTVEAPFMRQFTHQPLRMHFKYQYLGYQENSMTTMSYVYIHIPQPVQNYYHHPQLGQIPIFTPTVISELNFELLGAIGTIGIEVQEKVTSQMLPLIILPEYEVQQFRFHGGSSTELIQIDYFYTNPSTNQSVPASPFRNPEMIRQLAFSHVNVVSFNFGVFTNLVRLTFQGCFIAWNQPQSVLFPEFAIPQVQIKFFAQTIAQPILIPSTMNIDRLTFTNDTYINRAGGLLHDRFTIPTLTIHGRVKHMIFNHDTGIMLRHLRGNPKLPTTLESITLNITPTMSDQILLLQEIFFRLCQSTPNILMMGFEKFDLRSGDILIFNTPIFLS